MMSQDNRPMRARSRHRLIRSRQHRVFGGVCGGLAEFFGWSPFTVRMMFVLSCVLPGPQFVAYLILWLVIPNAPKRS